MGLGQNDNQLVTAVIHGFLNRNRIRHTAIVVKSSIDLNRPAGCRNRTGCHHMTIIILMHIFLTEISWLACLSIRCHQPVFHRTFHKGIKIQRICATGIGQCSIYILEPEKITRLQKRRKTKVALLINMLCVKTDISAPLSGYKRNPIAEPAETPIQ